MADRQLIARLAVAAIVVAGLAGVVLVLNSGDEQPPQSVAVVGEPAAAGPSSTRLPDRTVMQTPSAEARQADGDWQITYELAGTGTATVVYDENGLGLVHQELSVALPWRKELTWPNTGIPPRVQLQGQGDGQVECRVAVRGAVVTSQKAPQGEVATCEGKLAP